MKKQTQIRRGAPTNGTSSTNNKSTTPTVKTTKSPVIKTGVKGSTKYSNSQNRTFYCNKCQCNVVPSMKAHIKSLEHRVRF